MKKSDDVFEEAKKFIGNVRLKRDTDFIVVDIRRNYQRKNGDGIFICKATLIGEHIHMYLP